jgi:general secretion pathway protein F
LLFPASYRSLVDAGERSGALAVALDRLADSLARAHALREKIRSALIYPAVLLVLTAISVGIVLTVIVPQFRPMLTDAHVHLTLATRTLLALSDFVDAAWWSLPLAVIARLKEGQGLARPLAREDVLPAVAVHLIRIGEETGNLPLMLKNAAVLFEREVQTSLDRLMKLLVPLIIILMGAFIGMVIATVFTTIMNLNDLAS